MKAPKFRARAAASALIALAIAAASCGGGDDPAAEPGASQAEAPATAVAEPTPVEASETEAPATAVAEPTPDPLDGPPYEAGLAWGNFALSERIAAKLEAGEPLNFVVSLTAYGDTNTTEAYEHGWRQGAAEAAGAYGAEIETRVIGPNSADAAVQSSTIADLVATGDIDCLAVQAANPGLLANAIDAAVDAGVPVYAVGGDSPDSKRFGFYGLDDYAAGLAAGQLVGQWAADGGILVRVAAVLSGDAGSVSNFERMRGFQAGLLEIHSGVDFVNGPENTESLGFDPVDVYIQTEAWVLANQDVDIVFHTDRGLLELAAVMGDRLLYGDMYAVGFHADDETADYIRDRLVVAAMAQGHSEQARLAAAACGDFLLGGVHATGHITVAPTPITLDTVDEADWSRPENR